MEMEKKSFAVVGYNTMADDHVYNIGLFATEREANLASDKWIDGYCNTRNTDVFEVVTRFALSVVDGYARHTLLHMIACKEAGKYICLEDGQEYQDYGKHDVKRV